LFTVVQNIRGRKRWAIAVDDCKFRCRKLRSYIRYVKGILKKTGAAVRKNEAEITTKQSGISISNIIFGKRKGRKRKTTKRGNRYCRILKFSRGGLGIGI
jgi:hypothetical protein